MILPAHALVLLSVLMPMARFGCPVPDEPAFSEAREERVLSMMTALVGVRRVQALRPRARAIAATDADRLELRMLVAIDFRETTFRASARYPFGLSCCHRRSWSFPRDAAMALRILRTGRARCDGAEAGLRFYNTGGCQDGRRPRHRVARARWRRGRAYAVRVSATVERLLHTGR